MKIVLSRIVPLRRQAVVGRGAFKDLLAISEDSHVRVRRPVFVPRQVPLLRFSGSSADTSFTVYVSFGAKRSVSETGVMGVARRGYAQPTEKSKSVRVMVVVSKTF